MIPTHDTTNMQGVSYASNLTNVIYATNNPQIFVFTNASFFSTNSYKPTPIITNAELSAQGLLISYANGRVLVSPFPKRSFLESPPARDEMIVVVGLVLVLVRLWIRASK